MASLPPNPNRVDLWGWLLLHGDKEKRLLYRGDGEIKCLRERRQGVQRAACEYPKPFFASGTDVGCQDF